MKKIAFLLLVVMFVLTSCLKSNKLNNRLEGIWNVEKIGGSSVPNGLSYSFTFSKEKGGKGVFELSQVLSPLPAYTEIGTYTLIEDTRILLTFSPEQTDTLDVISYSNSTLSFIKGGQLWDLIKQ